jgi:hypothetical protein
MDFACIAPVTRIVLAGILGSIAMFIWTAIAHEVLPLGRAGIRRLPNEAEFIKAIGALLGPHRGLYIFPTPDVGPNPTADEKRTAMKLMGEKITTGPSGLLMYHPHRGYALSKGLLVEYLTELVEAILVVALLVQTRLTSFGSRVAFVTAAGILASIATNVSYWNWYGLSKRYTASYMFIQIVGFFLIGVVAAIVFRKKNA